jgi:hypothetical protein
MKLNKPYSLEQYASLAIYCNANNCHIEDRGEFLESVENPPYVPTTEDKIAELKNQLSAMDYKTSKYIDGEYTTEEWAEIVAERNEIRRQIRELENGL